MENLIKVLLPGNVESLERATEEPMMQIGAKRMLAAQDAQTTNHLPETDRQTRHLEPLLRYVHLKANLMNIWRSS